MTIASPPPLLISLDDLDAAAWAIAHPELVESTVFVHIDRVVDLEHEAYGEVMITDQADTRSAGTPAVYWVLQHVKYLWATDPEGPSRFVRDAVDRDAA